MNKESKIYIAGHRGLAGGAIHRELVNNGYNNMLCCSSDELDLRNQEATQNFFEENKPEYVFLAAARVGGIFANNIYRAQFIYDNLMIQSNVIHHAYLSGVKKLLFLGSTCIYPKLASQPMMEDVLLTGELEYSNEPYAIAKIAGMKMCENYNIQYGSNFISAMPTNLYGPGDNFDLENSHVLPALIRKIYLAKLLQEKNYEALKKDLNVDTETEVLEILDKNAIFDNKLVLWGSGKPLREFLWSEDLAKACVFLMSQVDFTDLKEDNAQIRNTHVNIGTGMDISIHDLAYLIKDVIGYNGDISFDATKPEGAPRKLTDVTKMHKLGWHHTLSLEEGVKKLFAIYANKEI